MDGSTNTKFIGDVMVNYSAHYMYKENQATSKSFYKQDEKWKKRKHVRWMLVRWKNK
jgi:hypothetical protein